MPIIDRKTISTFSVLAALLVGTSFSAFADEADEQTEEMTVMGAMKTPVVVDADIEATSEEAIEEIPVAVE